MKNKAEWLGRFKLEATGHLESAEPLLVRLDEAAMSDEEKASVLRQLFIKAHSVKGTASMLGLHEITDCAADLEVLWGEAWLEPTGYTQAQQPIAREHLAQLGELVKGL